MAVGPGTVNATAEIDDTGLRAASAANGGRLVLPNGVPFATPGPGDAPNIVFTSQWDNYPREATVPLNGRARHVYLLMAGSTNWMQSRLDNGEVDRDLRRRHDRRAWRCTTRPIGGRSTRTTSSTTSRSRRPEPIPPRVDLKTGRVRLLDRGDFKGKGRRARRRRHVLDLPWIRRTIALAHRACARQRRRDRPHGRDAGTVAPDDHAGRVRISSTTPSDDRKKRPCQRPSDLGTRNMSVALSLSTP